MITAIRSRCGMAISSDTKSVFVLSGVSFEVEVQRLVEAASAACIYMGTRLLVSSRLCRSRIVV